MASMTPASTEYFDRVAPEWDNRRASYFPEAVRKAAIRKAYLRSESVVADVGAGTGFVTAGLAPLVRRVYALDGSPAMLDVAKQNLAAFDNVVYQPADGLALPLPDESLDAVFANMYLHHCPDPQAAIREMVRLLRPGGRLVITDLDTHTYQWLKEEMADVWLGFDRDQVRAWFKEAGLVNVIIECTGESCCAESEKATNPDERQAKISTFVAVGTRRVPGVREAVQDGYSARALGQSSCCSAGPTEAEVDAALKASASSSPATGPAATSSACCGSTPAQSASACCGSSSETLISITEKMEINTVPGYSPEQKAQAPQEAADFSLGCGNPTALARMKPGEVVLDIGSGGGFDAFLSARQVGPTGKVIGVDMTPAMLERARRSAEKAGLSQVEFRQGHAEALPVEDGAVDVILSNCVINLTEDKGVVFGEAYRTLKPGGRLEVSDVVTDRAFPLDQVANPADWPGCVYGALPEQEYLDLVAQAGFTDIQVRRSASHGNSLGVQVYSALVSARKPQA